MLVDIFCDASIVPNTRWVCGGYLAINRDTGEEHTECIIESNGTNNLGEIMSIYYAMKYAVEQSKILPPDTRFRFFSDSKISVYGIKRWLPGWVESQDDDGILYSTSGQPVANQQYFIKIFNLMVKNKLTMNIYHQRGHVNLHSEEALAQAEHDFHKSNNSTLMWIGTTIEEISTRNAYIDNLTRETLMFVYQDPTRVKDIPYAHFEFPDPMIWRANQCDVKTFYEHVMSRPYKGG